jgi:hypothetical protein
LLFTEWPEDDTSAPLVIGVVGTNPFGKAAATIEEKRVGGRAIVFRYFPDPEEVVPTHVLFVPRAFDGVAMQLCRNLRNQPTLTVGEGEAFTRQGGMIRFFEQAASSGAEAVLRVEINEATADEAGLRFRSKLMRLAQRVRYPWSGAP